MIVAELKAGGGALGEGAKMLAHALTNGLERLEAIGASAGVEANALGRAVIDGNEHRRLTLAGHDRGQIAAPHDVDPLGGDRAVVGSRAMRAAGTLMRQQAMLAHEPQDAAPTGPRLASWSCSAASGHGPRSAASFQALVRSMAWRRHA